MSTIQDLGAKVDELVASSGKVDVLLQVIADLRSQLGALTPEQQAIVDGSVTKIQGVVDKLNAAQ